MTPELWAAGFGPMIRIRSAGSLLYLALARGYKPVLTSGRDRALAGGDWMSQAPRLNHRISSASQTHEPPSSKTALADCLRRERDWEALPNAGIAKHLPAISG